MNKTVFGNNSMFSGDSHAAFSNNGMYNKCGNMIFGPNGENYTKVGNMYMDNHGNTYSKNGNMIIGSDSNASVVGNTVIGHGTAATIGALDSIFEP